ncbi:MAG: hypothetical protein NVSMB47_14330 [Polyangiales bacterium]
MRLVFAAIGALVALVVAGCSPTHGDRFVETGGATSEVLRFATTTDGRWKVPLVRGLSWEETPSGSLLSVRAAEGPTYLVVAHVDGVPPPVDRQRCAQTHRQQLVVAFAVKGIATTEPEITVDQRRGEPSPRLHYAVPLQTLTGAAASTFSWWGYVLDGDRCLGVSVTTIVHGKKGDPEQPDLEDLVRLDRVYGVAMDGIARAKP